MKFTLKLDKSREEEVLIYAHEKSALTDKIEKLVLNDKSHVILGYKDDVATRIDESDVYCFFIEGGKLYALLDGGKFHVKMRLYELEALLSDDFVKINQSTVANITKVSSFGVSPGASLTVFFKNGHKDYVSRRQVKAVKKKLGF